MGMYSPAGLRKVPKSDQSWWVKTPAPHTHTVPRGPLQDGASVSLAFVPPLSFSHSLAWASGNHVSNKPPVPKPLSQSTFRGTPNETMILSSSQRVRSNEAL